MKHSGPKIKLSNKERKGSRSVEHLWAQVPTRLTKMTDGDTNYVEVVWVQCFTTSGASPALCL